MTRKEASDMIRDDIRLHHDFMSGEYRKALRMAIDVLEKLPEKHGRLIDEDDVIDAIHDRLHELQTHKEFIKKRGDIDLLGILPYIAKIQPIIEAEDEP